MVCILDVHPGTDIQRLGGFCSGMALSTNAGRNMAHGATIEKKLTVREW